MGDYSTSPDGERDRARRRPPGPIGLDPVSPTRFGEIIDGDRDALDPGARPQPYTSDMRKRDQFSRITWVMIVIAGVVLGVAMAMIAAS
jgi:hypothetical protein